MGRVRGETLEQHNNILWSNGWWGRWVRWGRGYGVAWGGWEGTKETSDNNIKKLDTVAFGSDWLTG